MPLSERKQGNGKPWRSRISVNWSGTRTRAHDTLKKRTMDKTLEITLKVFDVRLTSGLT
jgi:hypothetical protein